MPTGICPSLRRGLAVASLTAISVAVLMTVPMVSAHAACHAFTVTATPTTAAEGGNVVVTVHRDGDPHRVRMFTVRLPKAV